MQTIEEVRDMHERGASADALADPVRHARKLLDILEEEIDGQWVQVPDARSALAQMRRIVGEGC